MANTVITSWFLLLLLLLIIVGIVVVLAIAAPSTRRVIFIVLGVGCLLVLPVVFLVFYFSLRSQPVMVRAPITAQPPRLLPPVQFRPEQLPVESTVDPNIQPTPATPASAVPSDSNSNSTTTEPAPDWIRQKAYWQDRDLYVVLQSEVFATRNECENDILKLIPSQVITQLGQDDNETWYVAMQPHEALQLLNSSEKHLANHQTTQGTWHTMYVRIKLDVAKQQQLRRASEQRMLQERTGLVCWIAGGVLCLLGLAYTWLKKTEPNPVSNT